MTAIVVHKSEFHVSGSDDIVRVRQEVRKKAQELKFSIVDQTKLITAASELARNMILYAEQGDVIMEVLRSEGREGIRLIFTDKGPGIADVELALSDGYTTSGGMGLGLGGSKRLVNEFDITSAPGEGTTVTIVRWR